MAHSCFFVGLQSLWAWGFACVKEQVGCDDLTVSKRIRKKETEEADVPETQDWECTLILLLLSSETWVLVIEGETST